MPFKRHTRYDCILLEEVCRTIDNTSVLVLKILVVSIEAHVQMPYIKRQTRVSIFLHPSVSTITPGYRAWNKNHKTSYSAFFSRLPPKRKPLQKLLAACRVKEDHRTLCDDAAAQCLFAEQMCHAHPVLHRLAQRPPSVPASTITPDEIAYDDSKNTKKKRVAAPVCLMHTMVVQPACSTHRLVCRLKGKTLILLYL